MAENEKPIRPLADCHSGGYCIQKDTSGQMTIRNQHKFFWLHFAA